MFYFFRTLKRAIHKAYRVPNTTLVITALILILVSTSMIMVIEPETFARPIDGLWWTLVTLATVGYGDLFPKTDAGRLWGMFVIVVGIGLFTLAVGRVLESISARNEKRRNGDLDFKHGKNPFVVIIGWSQRSRITIKTILKHEPHTDVVLIDDMLETSPFEDHPFHFIKGIPSKDKTLHRAQITQAKEILIFAEERLKIENPYNADARTSFILTSVERIAPGVKTTVEVVLEENLPNFNSIAGDTYFRISDQAFADQMYPTNRPTPTAN